MMVRITGTLSAVEEEMVILERDGAGYEVHIPAFASERLTDKIGQVVTLYTIEYYEGSAMGGNLFPRMVGFLEPDDKRFFLEFVKVKGLGYRKALRAFARPAKLIASAIETSDVRFLASLPEIGKRTAEQLVASLRGKLSHFRFDGQVAVGTPAEDGIKDLEQVQREALEILVQLGEKRSEAVDLIRKVAPPGTASDDPGKIIEAVYKRKAGTI